jgi:hypothetical protein
MPTSLGFSQEPYLSQSMMYWANSTQPYMKSDGLVEAPGSPELRFSGPANAGAFSNARKPWAKMNATMNGFLHALPMSSVAQPSKLPLFWGMGKMNVAGFGYTNPALYCPYNVPDCRWSPTGQHQSAFQSPVQFSYHEFPEGWSWWTYGKGMNFTSVDRSAKFRTISAPASGAGTRASIDQPFSSMGPKGQPGGLQHCTKPSGYYQPCMFRPDSGFDYAGEEQLF